MKVIQCDIPFCLLSQWQYQYYTERRDKGECLIGFPSLTFQNPEEGVNKPPKRRFLNKKKDQDQKMKILALLVPNSTKFCIHNQWAPRSLKMQKLILPHT